MAADELNDLLARAHDEASDDDWELTEDDLIEIRLAPDVGDRPYTDQEVVDNRARADAYRSEQAENDTPRPPPVAPKAKRKKQSTTASDAAERDPRYLYDDFWQSRSELTQIHDDALRKSTCDVALLLAVLVRLAAYGSPLYVLPEIIGTPVALNLFGAIIGHPGAGKGAPHTLAAQLIEKPTSQECRPRGLGSAEGVSEGFFGNDGPPLPGTKKGTKWRKFYKTLIYASEGGALVKLGDKPDSNLFPTLAAVWMGESPPIGSGAYDDSTRFLEPLSYRCGALVTLQPAVAAGLLRSADMGLPQRFLWAMANPLTLPPDDEIDTQPLAQLQGIANQGYWDLPLGKQGTPHKNVEVPDNIWGEVKKAVADKRRMASQRPEEFAALPEGHEHEGLIRLKVAALLSILNGRLALNDDDWHLAHLVCEASKATRSWVTAQVRADAERAEEERHRKDARAQDARLANAAEWKPKVAGCKVRIVQAVKDSGGALKLDGKDGYYQNKRSDYRPAMSVAVEELTEADDAKYVLRGVPGEDLWILTKVYASAAQAKHDAKKKANTKESK